MGFWLDAMVGAGMAAEKTGEREGKKGRKAKGKANWIEKKWMNSAALSLLSSESTRVYVTWLSSGNRQTAEGQRQRGPRGRHEESSDLSRRD
jgi:hypothetical protein